MEKVAVRKIGPKFAISESGTPVIAHKCQGFSTAEARGVGLVVLGGHGVLELSPSIVLSVDLHNGQLRGRRSLKFMDEFELAGDWDGSTMAGELSLTLPANLPSFKTLTWHKEGDQPPQIYAHTHSGHSIPIDPDRAIKDGDAFEIEVRLQDGFLLKFSHLKHDCYPFEIHTFTVNGNLEFEWKLRIAGDLYTLFFNRLFEADSLLTVGNSSMRVKLFPSGDLFVSTKYNATDNIEDLDALEGWVRRQGSAAPKRVQRFHLTYSTESRKAQGGDPDAWTAPLLQAKPSEFIRESLRLFRRLIKPEIDFDLMGDPAYFDCIRDDQKWSSMGVPELFLPGDEPFHWSPAAEAQLDKLRPSFGL